MQVSDSARAVIDYANRDEKTREKIRSMMVGEKIKSDHHLIIVKIEGKEERQEGRKQKKKRIDEGEIGRRQGGKNSRKE